MNPLESFKTRLKQKPLVEPYQGVKVVLRRDVDDLKQEEQPVEKPIIIAERDDGTLQREALAKIKQHKLSTVVKKFPEEKDIAISKAPIIEKEPVKKAKKIEKTTVALEEENLKPAEILPEGGPRMDLENEEEVQQVAVVTRPKKRITKKIDKNILPSLFEICS